MKKIEKSEGIIINSSDYGETAVIIRILTPDSVESVIVKGVRKAGSGTLKYTNLLTKLSYNRTQSKLPTLTEAVIIDNYNKIKDDFDRYYEAEIIMELLNNFYIDITDFKILYDFLNTLFDLLKTTSNPRSISLLFMVKFLYLLGVAPLFKSCPKCGKLINSGYFSVRNGGYLCKECYNKYSADLDLDLSILLQKMYVTKINNIDDKFLAEIDKDELENVLISYYCYHLEFNSKVRKIKSKL